MSVAVVAAAVVVEVAVAVAAVVVAATNKNTINYILYQTAAHTWVGVGAAYGCW